MNTPNYRIVRAMLDRGNQPGLIREWFDGMKVWAAENKGQDAKALGLWLEYAKPRPFYTAEELAALWPAFNIALGMEKRLMPPPSANRLANELEFHRLPLFRLNAPGNPKYFIVERCGFWKDYFRNKTITPEEFHELLDK